MTLSLDRLAEIAAGATRGPWECPDDTCIIQPDGTYIAGDPDAYAISRTVDQEYVAAFSPDVTSRLIAELRAAREVVREARIFEGLNLMMYPMCNSDVVGIVGALAAYDQAANAKETT